MRFIRIGLLLLVTIILIAGLSFLFTQRDFLRSGNIPENSSSSSIGAIPEGTGSDRIVQSVKVPDEFTDDAPRGMQLTLPENLEISVFAAGLGKPRFFDFDDEGNIYVTDIGGGRVLFMPDRNHDGTADEIITVEKGLRNPHGIDFVDGDLYVAEEHQVFALRTLSGDGTYDKKEVVIENLPTGGGHVTRTVVIGPDDKIYVSVGSSCNVCMDRVRRAAILQYDMDGTNEQIIANGLRNAVGMVFSGEKLWVTENGRDQLGDNLPPEEINIVEPGKNTYSYYGWPYCHGRNGVSPEFSGKEEFCQTENIPPFFEMQAHSAPLGLAFYPSRLEDDQGLSKEFDDNLFVAFHGSWNRTEPTGYKIVRINPTYQQPEQLDVVSGWLLPNGTSWGRPVGVGFDQKGALFISDDKAGILYRVTERKNEPESAS